MQEAKNKDLFGYTESQYRLFRRNAWIVLLAFSILYCFLYCGRQDLSFAMPAMMEEEGWTALQLGILSSVQFWTYALGHLVNGRLGEIVGVNKLIIIGMVLSAAMNLLIGFSSSLLMIYGALGNERLRSVHALVAWNGADRQLVARRKTWFRHRFCQCLLRPRICSDRLRSCHLHGNLC